MPRLIPETPTFTTASEREVWERLRDSLGDDDVLLANLRLTDMEKDVEADLVVLMPDVGILVLEVKGGSVHVQADDADGHSWWTHAPRSPRRASDRWTRCAPPSTPSSATSSSTRDGGAARRVGWGHGLVVPYSSFAADFAFPSCRVGRCTTRATSSTLADRSVTTPGGCCTASALRRTTTSR